MTQRVFLALLTLITLSVRALPARAEDFLAPAHIAMVKPGKLVKVTSKGTFAPPIISPIYEGGLLTILGSTGSVSYSLPGSGWSSAGLTYKFDDGVCKVRLKQSSSDVPFFIEKIKAKCKGSTGTLSVPEPGPLEVVLTLTSVDDGQFWYCFECGGTPAGNPDKLFKAKDCAAPASCGGASCGNNVREGFEECDGTDAAACPGQCQANCTCIPMCPTTNGYACVRYTSAPSCSSCCDLDGPCAFTCPSAAAGACTDLTLISACAAAVNAAGCAADCCP